MNVGHIILLLIAIGIFAYGGFTYGQAIKDRKLSSPDIGFLAGIIFFGLLFLIIAIFK
jgi:hypothetical protein